MHPPEEAHQLSELELIQRWQASNHQREDQSSAGDVVASFNEGLGTSITAIHALSLHTANIKGVTGA